MEIHWMLFAPRRTDIHAEADNLKLNKMFICKAKNSQLLIAYISYYEYKAANLWHLSYDYLFIPQKLIMLMFKLCFWPGLGEGGTHV